MNNRAWAATSACLFFPVTAMLHHVVFFRPQCMLNSFEMPDYSMAALAMLLTADPSTGIGSAVALATWLAGRRFRGLRPLALAFVLAFLPLTIWLWDIPLSGRWVCHHLHDGNTLISSKHLYLFGAVVFAGLIWLHVNSLRSRATAHRFHGRSG